MATFTSDAATVIRCSAPGSNGTGPVSIPGLQVGDTVMRSIPDGFVAGMEATVSVADQLQQNANLDWSTLTITWYLIRGV